MHQQPQLAMGPELLSTSSRLLASLLQRHRRRLMTAAQVRFLTSASCCNLTRCATVSGVEAHAYIIRMLLSMQSNEMRCDAFCRY